ncbi:rhodanese-like domain-containing protein [Roseimaritima sediminicola]|uniref:rhodanese-like domain-containing protein n=1 Tax=Roseimaritima sediminicola TaxID=2662066 RepID=UPI001386F8EE|nr:rhodanese-like domain-containing protein [Roseimaritima sediminicola]
MSLRRLSERFVDAMQAVAPWLGREKVRTITTDELSQRLREAPESVLLVDVRTPAEIAVSRIPGAIPAAEFTAEDASTTEALVVAYCTVGGRSLLWAQTRTAEGHSVANYRGGILAWCSEGHPLVTPEGEPTNQLHTHTRFFSVPDGYKRPS